MGRRGQPDDVGCGPVRANGGARRQQNLPRRRWGRDGEGVRRGTARAARLPARHVPASLPRTKGAILCNHCMNVLPNTPSAPADAKKVGLRYRCFSENPYFCEMKLANNPLRRVLRFYINGFRNMTWGRTLWILILVKLFIIFVVLRLCFFRPALSGQSEAQKQETVGRNLTRPAQ